MEEEEAGLGDCLGVSGGDCLVMSGEGRRPGRKMVPWEGTVQGWGRMGSSGPGTSRLATGIAFSRSTHFPTPHPEGPQGSSGPTVEVAGYEWAPCPSGRSGQADRTVANQVGEGYAVVTRGHGGWRIAIWGHTGLASCLVPA